MSETWFSLGRNDDVEILAREWKPGDGVQCSFASHQRRNPCGPPAAVVETINYRRGPRFSNTEEVEKRIVRVSCAEHLAGRIGKRYGNARTAMLTRATKIATDQILNKYWKQYQAAYEKALNEEREVLLGGIPENLREIFLRSLADEDGDAE